MINLAPLLFNVSLFATMDTIFTNDFELGVCPDSQQENSNICYLPGLCTDPTDLLVNVDVTKFENIWGRAAKNDPITPWPGVSHYAAMVMNRNLFFATRFQVPTSGLSPTLTGLMTHAENAPGPSLTMSISSQCGDFSPASNQCLIQNQGPGGIIAKWRLPTGSGNGCVLTPGQTYYLNFKLTDPEAVDTQDCDDYLCVVSIVNNLTN